MTHYQTLGVREGANPVEIQAAYVALNEVHKSSADIELQLEIAMAYQTLIHPVRRTEYDSLSTRNAEKVEPMDAPTQIFQFRQEPQEIRVVNHYVQGSQTYPNQQTEQIQKVVIYFFMGLIGTMFLLAIGLVA